LAHLENRNAKSFQVPNSINAPRGVFVTLYEHAKELRGCIGHIAPMCSTLAEEVAECARSAAFEDPRFPPLKARELRDVQIEVSILGSLSPVTAVAELNPKKFGVVVSAGFRRGLLLPDIDGVDTVDMQIDIARRKAGIATHEPIRIEKFEIEKIRM
jgi:AmmeMemoRadiSam system protein A